MKKKLIALVTSLTLCAAVVVGTTLAYYSNETAEEVNTFTYAPDEDPGPEIVEPHWPEDPTITPDKVIPKDPMVTLTNKDAELQYYVAMVISGRTERDEQYIKDRISNLKGILAQNDLVNGERKPEVEIKKVQATDKYGKPLFEADGVTPVTKDVEIYKDKGIATISGWSADYDYQIDTNTGTVYAYYKTTIGKDAGGAGVDIFTTKPVFEGLQMNRNINHFFDALTDNSPQWTKDAPAMFEVVIKGYVVSSLNDTKITGYDSDDKPIYAPWSNCIEAMQTAFPTTFYADPDAKTAWATANPITDTYPDAGATVPGAGVMP